MANQKISQLTAVTSVASADYFPVVVDATTSNARVSVASLLASIPAGSAASPSIAFTGDTNTGIYSPGADQVAISTGGSGRLFVDASGNVGVGATPSAWASPFVAMQIGAGGAALAGRTDSQQVSLATNWRFAGSQNLYISNGFASRYFQESGVHVWQTASSGTAGNAITFNEAMRLDTSGRLGVGTSSPQTGILDLTRNGTAGTVSSFRQLRIGLDANGNYSGFIGYGSSVAGQSAGLIIESLDNGAASKTVINPSGGNVGIGNTAPRGALDVTGNIFVSGGSQIQITGNSGTTGLQLIGQDSAESLIGTMSAQALAFRTNSTERARIDSSGRLLVGTSSGSDNNALLKVQGNVGGSTGTGWIDVRRGLTTPGANSQLGLLSFSDASGNHYAFIEGYTDATTGTNDYPGRLVFSTTADGASSPTERMRISADGKVSIGSAAVTNGPLQVYNGNSSQGVAFVASDGSGNEWHFGRGTADGYFYVVRQTGTGMYMNTNSWVATSDQRAKQNIADIESTIDVVKALKPSRFNWKADGSADVGFIAQQVQPLIPEAVVDSGEPDAMLGITQDKLLPFVVKALQEAVAKIESLEARLTAAGI